MSAMDAPPEPALGARTPADRAWIAGLFAAALLLRLVHLVTVRRSPLFDHLFIDPKMYDEWGQRIAAGHLLGEAPFFLDPLYPYFVGAVYAVTGRSLVAVAAVQSLLGALVAPLVFDAARPWLGRVVPKVAGIVAALYLPAIFFGAVLMKPALALFVVAAMLWLLSRAWLHGRSWDWVLAGTAIGLAGLARGSVLWVIPVLAVAIAFEVRRAGSRRSLAAAASFVAGAVAVTIPTLCHNWAASGELIPTTTNWGQIYFIGNNPDNPHGRFMELPFVRSEPVHEQADFKREAERRAGRPLRHREVSRFWFGEARDWIRSDPAGWLRLIWRKLRAYWGGFEIPDNLDYYLVRERAPVLRWPGLTFGLVAPFGLLGAGLALRERGWPRLLAVVVLCYAASVIAFFVLARFRMAMMPALYVLAAHGAVTVGAAAWRARRDSAVRRRALGLVAALLVAAGFVNLPLRVPRGSPLETVAHAVGLAVRVETSATGRFNLGVAYAARAGDADDPTRWLELAEQELRRAWAEESRYASVPVELGKVLARLGRDREAIEVYRAAAEVEPGDYKIYHALGLLYRRLGELQQAATSFRTALAIEPRHAASAVQLGETLLALGRAEEAATAFRHALTLAPGDERSAAGLRQAEASARGSS